MALGDATVDDSSNTAAPDRPGVGRGETAGDADGERRAIADGSSSAALTNEADAPESAGEGTPNLACVRPCRYSGVVLFTSSDDGLAATTRRMCAARRLAHIGDEGRGSGPRVR